MKFLQTLVSSPSAKPCHLMKHLDFAATLDYLYTMLPMYQRVGSAAYKKDLTNTYELLWALGRPQWRFPSIHIAGTNGKGSTSSMLAAVLQAQGFKTGLYTSPHLVSFTERIRVDGREIAEDAVVEFVARMKPHIERIQPSFFELTVAMAFEHFAQSGVHIAVVETGLGGRLDSTNVLRPELSVITHIDYDHMDMLGDTLALIAGEKAGIIKHFTPVVVSERHPETAAVFEAAAIRNEAPLTFAPDRWAVHRLGGDLVSQHFRATDLDEGETYTYFLDLPGHYQAENLTLVLSALSLLRESGWDIGDDAVEAGLRSVRTRTGLRGRMERLSEYPLTICDIAHNPNGVAAVMAHIRELPHANLHMVWGMVRDKDHHAVLSLLPPTAQYYFARPDVPRGLDADQLQTLAQEHGLHGQTFGSVVAALDAARRQAGPSDLIFVGGSTFVVADAFATEQSQETA
ncbi:MAG: folylpolyglutamate synthase/dihydrofolate synthase family protein [Bacteroidia bacterium]